MIPRINRRSFLQSSALACGALASASFAAASRRPTLTLISGWQEVNIGDVAHTPGVLSLLQKHIPESPIILWPSGKLSADVTNMLRRNFPNLEILSNEEEIFRRTDFLLHGSGPSVNRADRLRAFDKATGKPFGILGTTIGDPAACADVLDRARFIYTRETASLKRIRDHGAKCPVTGFAPDGTFAMTIRDDEKAQVFLREHDLEPGNFICVVPRLRYTPYHKIRPQQNPTPEQQRENRRKDEHNEKYAEPDHAKVREAMIRWVRETGHKVLVCPEMTYQLDIMQPLLIDPLPDDVKARVARRRAFWLPDEAASTYARARAVLSFECHSPIMAVAAGTPAFYLRQPEDTIKGQMWYDIGLKDWVFEIDRTTGERIADRLMEVHADHDSARRKIATSMEFVRKQYEQAMPSVAQAVSAVSL